MGKLIFTFLLSVSAVFSQGWRLPIRVVESTTIQIEIGMDPNATDKFDRGVDLPAPPVPPTFYAFIPYDDPQIPFLPALWKDIRAVSDSARWSVSVFNAASPITVQWDTAQAKSIGGYITIEDKDIVMLRGKIELPARTSKFDIKYSKNKTTEAKAKHKSSSVEIKLSIPKSGNGKVIFYDKSGVIVDSLNIGQVHTGDRKITWNPVKLKPGVYLYRVIVESDTVGFGKVSVISP